MQNLEGIRNVEIPEANFEKDSVRVHEGKDLDFDDCIKTKEDIMKELKELDFEDCAIDEQVIEPEDDFEDCRIR